MLDDFKYRYYLIYQNIYFQPVGDYIEIYLTPAELQEQKDAGRVLFKTEAEVLEYFEKEGIKKL